MTPTRRTLGYAAGAAVETLKLGKPDGGPDQFQLLVSRCVYYSFSSSGASQFQLMRRSATSGGFNADTLRVISSDGMPPTTSNLIVELSGPDPKKRSFSSL